MAEQIQLFAYRDCILLTLNDRIIAYNVPPLLPYTPSEAAPEYEPLISIFLSPKSSDSFFIEYNNVTASLPTSNRAHHLFLVDFHHLTVLEVHDINPTHNPRLANKLPFFGGSLEINDARFRTGVKDTYIDTCAEWLCLTAFDGTAVSVSLFKAIFISTPQEQINFSFFSSKLGHPPSFDVLFHEFSPVLGRNCLLTTKGDVIILDYLG
ncbi:hypothetical protein CVT26_012348 [Gymnopilus dilepis]|uniref:Cleavage/polyadenylation specificity factor A subunit N-terminal domain-containing protein n=1 Tax=Gymnopilus dilepis TaxID=231916 RepID=A0A409YQ38_9AGAR|nr:hypothetical protein CVT26_012348 [Gymnopilus dilepis]